MKYNKLVRDRIPDIIMEDNREPKTRILSEKEFITELERCICGGAETQKTWRFRQAH